MRLKDSHPGNLVRIPSQRLQHGHKQPTTNNCIQQLFYNFNNNIQTRNQPPDNHQPPDNPREFLHTHTHQTQAFGCAWFVPSQRLERSDNFGGWDRVLVGNSRWRNGTKSWCSAPQEIMKTRRTWWMTRKLYVYIACCVYFLLKCRYIQWLSHCGCHVVDLIFLTTIQSCAYLKVYTMSYRFLSWRLIHVHAPLEIFIMVSLA